MQAVEAKPVAQVVRVAVAAITTARAVQLRQVIKAVVVGLAHTAETAAAELDNRALKTLPAAAELMAETA
jgi:hypothetical protein